MYSLIGFLLVVSALADDISYQDVVDEQWQAFKLEHGKFYQDEDEEQHRQSVFMENLRQINEHNQLHERGLKSYKMAINHFGDLTADEFMRYYTVEMPELTDYPQNVNSDEMADDYGENMVEEADDFIIHGLPKELNDTNLPQFIDWRHRGAVTPVKNQGQCGSCWSFSATGALEAQWFKRTHRLVSLSEQNLVDCSWKYGNHGCNGGWMHWAYNYIRDNRGIDTEQSYPYRAANGFCHYNPRSRGASVSRVVQFRGEHQLEVAVSHIGPIAVAIQVVPSFQHYHSGVYNEFHCGHKLNHAVLVVGFGHEGGGDYWLVKNSWGAGWGDQGYIKMSRNRNNQCGIADGPTYPVV